MPNNRIFYLFIYLFFISKSFKGPASGRKTSGFRIVQILTIFRTSEPDVMSGRALLCTVCIKKTLKPNYLHTCPIYKLKLWKSHKYRLVQEIHRVFYGRPLRRVCILRLETCDFFQPKSGQSHQYFYWYSILKQTASLPNHTCHRKVDFN